MTALALLTPAIGSGQESVRSAIMVADLTGEDGAAEVRIEFVVDGIDPGGSVDASVLDFGAAAVSDVRWGASGGVVALSPRQGVARGAALPVQAGTEPGTGRVVVTYRVARPVTTSDGRLRGHVPVIGVDRAPREAGPDLFRTELRLPPEWVLTEGFPTGLTPAGEAGVYEATLSVVPSVVSFRARSSGSWRPGLPLVLDVLAAVIIFGFALVGWRHLRQVAA